MKPETGAYLAKARHWLAGAKRIAAAEVPDVAAREAYLAVYHAAEAYIFERTGKTVKTMASGASSTDWHNKAANRERASHLSYKDINSRPSPITASAS